MRDVSVKCSDCTVFLYQSYPNTSFAQTFRRAATLYDRWSPSVEIGTEHADFFTRNLVAILAEQRLALAQKNAAGVTYGDFGNVA